MTSAKWPKYQPGFGEVDEKLLLEPPTVQEKIEADWETLRDPKEPDEADDDFPSVGDEQLKVFIRGVLNGDLFVSDQVREPNMLSMVFLPLAFGALATWSKAKVNKVGIIYAPMSAALPRSINSYPCFGEMRMLNKDDWNRARLVIVREQERQKNIDLNI